MDVARGPHVARALSELESDYWRQSPQRRALWAVSKWLVRNWPRLDALGGPTKDLRLIQIAIDKVRRKLTRQTTFIQVIARIGIGAHAREYRLSAPSSAAQGRWSFAAPPERWKQGLHPSPVTDAIQQLQGDWGAMLLLVAGRHDLAVDLKGDDFPFPEMSAARRRRGRPATSLSVFNEMLDEAAACFGLRRVSARESLLLQALVGVEGAGASLQGKGASAARAANRKSASRHQAKRGN